MAQAVEAKFSTLTGKFDTSISGFGPTDGSSIEKPRSKQAEKLNTPLHLGMTDPYRAGFGPISEETSGKKGERLNSSLQQSHLFESGGA